MWLDSIQHNRLFRAQALAGPLWSQLACCLHPGLYTFCARNKSCFKILHGSEIYYSAASPTPMFRQSGAALPYQTGWQREQGRAAGPAGGPTAARAGPGSRDGEWPLLPQ